MSEVNTDADIGKSLQRARREGYDKGIEEAARVVDHLADGEAKSYNAREEDALRTASELIRALRDTEE